MSVNYIEHYTPKGRGNNSSASQHEEEEPAMPAALSYPGVYIEELPSGVRTITGVATSITAFVGRAMRGPADEPVRIFSFADYERTFGGLWADSTMSFAVNQYFQNGGSDAIIVRIHNGALTG